MSNTEATACFKIRPGNPVLKLASERGWASIRNAVKTQSIVPEDGEATADEAAAERKDRAKAVRRDSLRSIDIMDSLALPFAPPSMPCRKASPMPNSSSAQISTRVPASTLKALGSVQAEMRTIRVELKEMRVGMQEVLQQGNACRDDLQQVLQLLRQQGGEDGLSTMHSPPIAKARSSTTLAPVSQQHTSDMPLEL
jgi:hypothetical protein